MAESPGIEGLLQRIRREIRRRRAEYYGLRGAFWGAVGGVAVLPGTRRGLARSCLAGAQATQLALDRDRGEQPGRQEDEEHERDDPRGPRVAPGEARQRQSEEQRGDCERRARAPRRV